MARIVIIDDCETTKLALDRAISGWGHETLSTSDPLLGLELAVTVSPDLVVADYDGPCMDALTLVRELHEVLQHECPAVLLISDAERADVLASLPGEAVPAGFLPKPHQPAELAQAIHDILAAPPSSARRELMAVLV